MFALSTFPSPGLHGAHALPVKPSLGWYWPAAHEAHAQPLHGSYSPAPQPLLTGSGVGARPQEVEPAGQVSPLGHGVHDEEAS